MPSSLGRAEWINTPPSKFLSVEMPADQTGSRRCTERKRSSVHNYVYIVYKAQLSLSLSHTHTHIYQSKHTPITTHTHFQEAVMYPASFIVVEESSILYDRKYYKQLRLT